MVLSSAPPRPVSTCQTSTHAISGERQPPAAGSRRRVQLQAQAPRPGHAGQPFGVLWGALCFGISRRIETGYGGGCARARGRTIRRSTARPVLDPPSPPVANDVINRAPWRERKGRCDIEGSSLHSACRPLDGPRSQRGGVPIVGFVVNGCKELVALVTKALSRAAQGGSATTKWRVAETCNGCRVLVALASRRHCFLRKSCLCPTWGDDDTLLCAPCYDDSPWGFAGRRVQSCPSLRIDGAILSLEILHSFLHARICLSVWLGISSELRPRMDFVSLVCGIPPVGPGVGHGKEEGRRGVVTAAHHFAAKKDAMTNAQRVVSIQGKTPTTFMVLVAPASESNILRIGDDDWDVFGQLVDGGARFCVGCSLWK
ncbi:hypothetical protein G6O67_008160 [Ophiocordyceps sinensis]|uniref:Uncharacterized protein n=1 Tax=Ophiocordyceps sinensis TaxID=72228 RepID=A0A8H4LTA2_9HYPO|nr:hypothetical protein G6O67_008160 [Ophiocordyceps sinensis]